MTGRQVARSLLAAVAWAAALAPTTARPNVMPNIGLYTDYLRLGAGFANAFDVGTIYSGDVGFIIDGGDEKALCIGPVAGLGVRSDFLRLSIGPQLRNGWVVGPEFLYRRVGDDEGRFGGAVNLGLEFPLRVFSMSFEARLGGTTEGFFAELGLIFGLRIPAGPRAREQLLEMERHAWGYPRCGRDENCAWRDEFCVNGRCQECREDADCQHVVRQCINRGCMLVRDGEPVPGTRYCPPGGECIMCQEDAQCPEVANRCIRDRCALVGPDTPLF